MKNHNNIYNSYTKFFIPAIQTQNYILHVNNQYFRIAITVFPSISVFKYSQNYTPLFLICGIFIPFQAICLKVQGMIFSAYLEKRLISNTISNNGHKNK